MKRSTLCYCIQNNQVLLGMKRRGFGEGKWNGYGGKVTEEETPRAAAVRELFEESGLSASEDAVEQVALIQFYFEETPVFECFIFLLKHWNGTPTQTEEMTPQWFPVSGLPFDQMWIADRQWIPMILSGKKIKGKVTFSADGSELRDSLYNECDFSYGSL
ncbi:MAG: 8-oxo-dGTP diphosphatase [Patescibacteria group bacterium]|jgi:ADP-ribose pyrophosphatase YjhB (NUDIX family)